MPYIEPYSVVPLGLFSPTTLALLPFTPPAVLAEVIDYGETDLSKPGRRPTFEVLSLTESMHPIDQQVCIALTLAKATGAAVLNDGNDFASVKKNGSDAPTLLRSIAKNALKRLIANGDIALVGEPLVTQSADGAEITVNYRNLRAKDSQRVRSQSVPIPNSAVSP